MSARATWKGVLRIGLVTIPIKVFPATSECDGLSFNQLHNECQGRITQRKWCTNCAREVLSAEIVKGFEFEKGKYVILLPEELDAVQPPSTRVIDLTTFADEGELHPLFIDRSYYLAPDGGPAAEAYVLMREGMVGQVGIGKLAIYGREYLVAVRQHGYTLMLHTLHHAAEIRGVDVIEDLGALLDVTPDPRQLRLAKQVIASFHGPLVLDDFTDAYHSDLRRLIDAKIAGEEIIQPKAETEPVLDLKAALIESLGAVKRPAKVAPTAKRKRAS